MNYCDCGFFHVNSILRESELKNVMIMVIEKDVLYKIDDDEIIRQVKSKSTL